MLREGHVGDVPAKREKGRESLGPLFLFHCPASVGPALVLLRNSQAPRGGLAAGKTKPRLEGWNARCCPPSGSILSHADTVMPP